jgi:hypothetical protein
MRTLTSSTVAKLFATGFTVGPVVDSLHNQCLLKYHVLPIELEWPHCLAEVASSNSWILDDYPYFFCSSWTVPPLLGIAYVVLGGLLPRLLEDVLGERLSTISIDNGTSKLTTYNGKPDEVLPTTKLRNRALLAVATTAMIIKLSEVLETQHPSSAVNFIIDGGGGDRQDYIGTSIGGPLSELPFVAHGVWEYLDSSADYLPLRSVPPGNVLLEWSLNDNYSHLALSSITGPCYFAVTMDAIALGRWFDSHIYGTKSSVPEKRETNLRP